MAGETAWDSEVRGFGVRRQTEKRVYLLKTRVAGKQRWITIGEHGAPWTPTTARNEAQRLWGMIREGKDPAAARLGGNQRPNMAELCRRFIDEYARQHKKPSSTAMDQMNIDNHVLPLLGTKVVGDVTRADIDVFKRAVREGKTARGAAGTTGHRGGALVTGGPGVANRCLSLLSKMFNLAERWGLRPDGTNPVRHVERYREEKKERFLSLEELGRLGEAIRAGEADGENAFTMAALRLLIFTGARLGEILNLRWEEVDLEKGVLALPDSKTGRKRIYLNPPALDVLRVLPNIAGNPFVVVGHRRGARLVNLQKPWRRVRERAGLSDVRMHDLRHSFASVAVASGLTLPLIGKLLGHPKSATTERYANLALDPWRAANDRIGEELTKALGS
jgi:integrase